MRATPALAARAQVCEHPALARSASATSLLAPDRRSPERFPTKLQVALRATFQRCRSLVRVRDR